jgi:hypothetical protein
VVKIAFRSGTPVIYNNTTYTTQSEQCNLLKWLVVSTEVFRGQSSSVNKLFVSVHAIENNHRFTVIEDAQIRNQLLRELVE